MNMGLTVDNVATCCISNHRLQFKHKYVILLPYSEYGKEVYRARHDRTKGELLHDGASCRNVATHTGKRGPASTEGGNARSQSRGYVADQQKGVRTVHGNSEERLPGKGKLTTLSAVQRQLPSDWNPVGNCLSPYCFHVILQHMAVNCNVCNTPQLLQAWGSVEEEYHMLAIYKGRFYLLRPSSPSTQPRCQCGKPATYHTNDIYFCGRCLGRILLTLQHYTLDEKHMKEKEHG